MTMTKEPQLDEAEKQAADMVGISGMDTEGQTDQGWREQRTIWREKLGSPLITKLG